MKRNIYGCIITLLTIFGIIKNEAKPSEYEGRKYKLEARTPFYKGLPPTRNQSGIHEPSTYIAPCMVLVFEFESECRKYVSFTVKTNDCGAESSKAKNNSRVYYKKDLFNNLGKYELRCNEN